MSLTPFRSSTGLPDNLAAFLCHLMPFVGGLVFLVLERKSRFVLFHALQSVLLFGSLFILHAIAGFIPVLGILLSIVLTVAGIFLWASLVISSLQRKWVKLPLIGDFAEHQIRHW